MELWHVGLVRLVKECYTDTREWVKIYTATIVAENRQTIKGILVYALFGDYTAQFLCAIPATPLNIMVSLSKKSERHDQ